MSTASSASPDLALDIALDFGPDPVSPAPLRSMPDLDSAPPCPPERGALMDTGPSKLSGHGFDDFIRCPQLWAYKRVLGVVDSSASGPNPHEERLGIVRGTLLHQGLALYYRRIQARQQGESVDAWAVPEDGIVRLAYRNGPAWVAECWTVLSDLYDYLAAYAGEEPRVLGVEHSFDLTATSILGVPLTRSVDLWVCDAAGRNRLIDHKRDSSYSANKQEETIDGYSIDGQFADYHLLAEALWGRVGAPGSRNGGVWINLCGAGPDARSALREPASPSDLRRRFQRVEVGRSERVLRKRLARARDALAQQRWLQQAGTDPWEYPTNAHVAVCRGPWGLCEGYDLCWSGKQGL